ncbi:winged helix-turn-helix transcriptional regulator [Cuniculiplasma sp. SKW3]|uniref:winged helix-turn-helix transcriptional regulator n=1 Tax=unclassified Cuniculiplasma TaxID=2619706 RepID=UPI003FD00EBA
MIRYGNEVICVDPSIPIFSILGKKYTILIMGALSGRSERATFNQIRKSIPEASARVISIRLREMEDKCIIRREIYENHITYYLTETGLRIKESLKSFFVLMANYKEKDLKAKH